MSSENKVVMTRVIVGVASVGATLALVYLYNKFQQKRGKGGDGSSGGGISRARRQSAKSGDGVTKKVTFKTDDDTCDTSGKVMVGSVSGNRSVVVPSTEEDGQSKFLKHDELNNKQPPVMARHDAQSEQGGSEPSTASAECHDSLTNNDSSTTTTPTNNSYESNSTLKLDDSVATSTHPVSVQEEVITRSEGPLMTSTPLPGKDSVGIASLRKAAAVFEPHSDLQSSAQVDGGGAGGNGTVAKVDATEEPERGFQRTMRIPREIVPGLIGKRGCNIKGIQAQSGTTIAFNDETLENGDRICVIKGAPGNVTIAESLIEKFIMDQPTVYTETLTVPVSSVGRIIGRGGESIRQIQELSKARVNVESHNHYASGDGGPTRSITIRGSESQILIAKQLITEKVDEERNLRKTIEVATASRTPRRAAPSSPTSSSLGQTYSSASSSMPALGADTEPVLPLKQDGILEVFVSCVYHPNDFWIQVVGRDSIELDKLCESMTDHYHSHFEQNEPEFSVGDIVAAPFEVDGKMYRAKVMRIDDNGIEVSYLDYGDRRVLPASEVFELHSSFLKLRFQAIQATLNLGCIGEKWEDEVINEFCDLTFCAQWQSLTARVKDYLKDVEDGHDVIWIELLDKNVNIGEELVRKNLATPKGPSGCNGAQGWNKKSYAAAALGLSSTPSEPLITAEDPTVQESLENERNGN